MTSTDSKNYNARLITPDQATIALELTLVGVQVPGQQIIGTKSDYLVVKLDGLACLVANVLKQEMLARGGDCAVSRDCLTLERETTSVLLIGTREQYDSLVGKLPSQGFDLQEVSRQIAALLADIEVQLRPLQLGRYTIARGERTLVMGIMNMTTDSFSGDALGKDIAAALAQARRMHAEGADILDIGGESTRPGSEPVPEEEELRRVVPIIERLSAPDGVPLPISIDTRKARVARAAVEAGAVIINDVSGLRDDSEMASVAAETGAGLVVMHIQGTPRNMQQNPHYDDLLGEVIAYLREGVDKAVAAGVNKERIWVDPGIGFGKTVEHDLELLRRLGELRSLGCGILVGTSRKSFIGRVLARSLGGEIPPPRERVVGTGTTTALAVARGAEIVRVHDIVHNVQVARMADAIVKGLS